MDMETKSNVIPSSESHDASVVPKVEDRIWAALLYLIPFFWLVALFMFTERPFIYAHAKQVLVIYLISAISTAFNVVPILGWIAFFVIMFLVAALSVIGFFYALLGNVRVPVLGALSDKLPFKE